MNYISGKTALFIIFLLPLLIFGCGEGLIESTWKDREITIDGVDTEWEGARYHIESNNVTIGLMNDEAYIYLRLSTRDRVMQRKMLILGFNVWFDAKGGKRKICGVKFPIGTTGKEMLGEIARDMTADDRPPSKEEDYQMMEMIREAQRGIALMSYENDLSATMSINDAAEHGILAKINSVKGNMVYELRVPLKRNDILPYGIGFSDKDMIGIGFEAGEMSREMRNQMRIDRANRGGMGRGQQSALPDISNLSDTFELWLKANILRKNNN